MINEPTMKRDKKNKTLLIISVFLVIVILYLYRRNTQTYPYPLTNGIISVPDEYFQDDDYLKISDVVFPKVPYKWYEQNCFSNSLSGRSIDDIYTKLSRLRTSSIKACKDISYTFDKMFALEEKVAPLTLPDAFKPQVLKWLNSNEQLFNQIHHQTLYKVTNIWTYEESIYNPLRSKRPTAKTDTNALDYIESLFLMTKKDCDFCSYKDHTAADIFGRVDNKFSASASNTFKLAKFHGLFFPKTHHPLHINFTVLSEIFLETSQEWFREAYKSDPKQIYPSLIWDSLPHAGASQFHPHIHGMLGEYQYSGHMESMHNVAQHYYYTHKRSYWTDFIMVHWALGLAIQTPQAFLIVPLSARKDHEYMIISPTVNEDAVILLHKIIEGYKKNLGVFCWSGGGAYPVMNGTVSGLPMVFRISSRGVCTSIASDVSSLELYTANNINTDLETTFLSIQDKNDNNL